MGNRNTQPSPPPPYKCCNHLKPSFNIQQCPQYQKFISPCCIHKNQSYLIHSCRHINIFNFILCFNLFQIAMILANIACFILPTSITISCGIVCIVYIYSPYYNREDRKITVFVLGVCAVDVISEILMVVVPRILVSYQMIFLGIIAYVWMREIVKRKARYSDYKIYGYGTQASAEQQIKIRNQSIVYEQKCCICLVQNSNYLLLPCMHLNYCKNCVAKIETCSLCRKPISEKIQTNSSKCRRSINQIRQISF